MPSTMKMKRLAWRKAKASKKSGKKLARPATKAVKTIVKRAIRSSQELKCAPALTIFDQATTRGTGLDYNLGIGLTSTGIVPFVPQGTQDGQRVGNSLNAKKLVLRYTIQALPVTLAVGSNPNPGLPFLCRVIVYRHRYAMDDPQNNNILNIGGSSSTLGSTPDYYVEPYNREEFIIVHSKQFLMQPVKTFYSGTAAAITDNVANGTKTFVSKKAIIKVPKKLVFNDSTSVPTNCQYFMAVAVCNIDGTTNTTSVYRAQVNAESFLYYTDA